MPTSRKVKYQDDSKSKTIHKKSFKSKSLMTLPHAMARESQKFSKKKNNKFGQSFILKSTNTVSQSEIGDKENSSYNYCSIVKAMIGKSVKASFLKENRIVQSLSSHGSAEFQTFKTSPAMSNRMLKLDLLTCQDDWILETRRKLFEIKSTTNNNDEIDEKKVFSNSKVDGMGMIAQLNSTFGGASVNNSTNNNSSAVSLEERHSIFLSRLNYEVLEELGAGGYSKVYKLRKKNYNPTTTIPPTLIKEKFYACKIFDFTKIDKVWMSRCLGEEMTVMFKIFHPNIVHARDLIKTQHSAYIVMDYAKNGNISSYMSRMKMPLTEQQARIWFRDIMQAIDYLHTKNISHRDLKLENFLIDENYQALLSDFSFSVIGANRGHLCKTQCGTFPYSAPEIYDGKEYDPFAADIFSMGVNLFEMINYESPFINSSDPQEMIKIIINQSFSFNSDVTVSEQCRSLAISLMDLDPKRRPTTKVILNHPWVCAAFTNISLFETKPPFSTTTALKK